MYLSKFLEKFETKKEEKPIGETTMNFGKQKGQTYDYIYDNDQQYTKWIVTTTDTKYVKKIKAYFLQKIEEQYNIF